MPSQVKIISEAPEEYKSSSNKGTLFNVNIKNGTYVRQDTIIFEVEFEKFIAEVVATDAGKIINFDLTEGSVVQMGDLVCEIDITAKKPWIFEVKKYLFPFAAFISGVILTLVFKSF
ncbi:hypothetical protein SOPP22_12510 [Shewanella sp. OPT22]|nr:hypothetical protein SOPP22_12510 [Shewanella sp. OPT22]